MDLTNGGGGCMKRGTVMVHLAEDNGILLMLFQEYLNIYMQSG